MLHLTICGQVFVKTHRDDQLLIVFLSINDITNSYKFVIHFKRSEEVIRGRSGYCSNQSAIVGTPVTWARSHNEALVEASQAT